MHIPPCQCLCLAPLFPLQCLPPPPPVAKPPTTTTTSPPPANSNADDEGETAGEPEAPNTTPAPSSPTPAQLKDDLTCGCDKSESAAVAISQAIASGGGCSGAAGQALARELTDFAKLAQTGVCSH